MPPKTQTKKYVYHHKVWGNIHVTETTKVKRLSLSLIPNSGIHLKFSPSMPFDKALSFLESKSEWIEEKMQHIRKIEEKHTQFQLFEPFTLGHLNFTLVPTLNRMFTTARNDDFIELRLPKDWVPGQTETDTKIRRKIELILADEAKRKLTPLIKKLADIHHIPFNSLQFSNARTYWGLCSASNNITLNIHLIRLPAHLQVYVILHELAHVVHKNHSADFWNFLSKLMNTNSRKIAKELKAYRINIF